MKEYFQDFLLMLQFLTRIPIKLSLPCEMKNFKRGTTFFSIIGFIIGAIQLITYYLLIKVLPLNVVVVFIILVEILITGGLHMDGLGDTCDGFFALKGSDKILEIMKDSRIGAFACIAIIFDILFKYSIYSNFLFKGNILAILIVPTLGRFAISFLALIGTPAKKNGSGNLFIGNISIISFLINLVVIVFLCFFIVGIKYAVIITAASIIIINLFNKLCISKMSGITGDSLGAANEIAEILTLVILCTPLLT